MLNGNIETEVLNLIEENLTITNVVCLYYIPQLFNSSKLSKSPKLLVERCFPMIVNSTSFIELDFKHVAKILSSSELNIDSEMEVFNAITSWLSHDKERNKYAKRLFIKIRLSLLSDHALKFVSEKISYFVEDLSEIKELISKESKISHSNKSKITSRYCNQNNFNKFCACSFILKYYFLMLIKSVLK